MRHRWIARVVGWGGAVVVLALGGCGASAGGGGGAGGGGEFRVGCGGASAGEDGGAVRAENFRSVKVYQSKERPSVTAWVSFFPGVGGECFLSCEEVTRPAEAKARATTRWIGEMSLPRGYDKSDR